MTNDKRIGFTLVAIALFVALVLIVTGNDAGSTVEIGLLK